METLTAGVLRFQHGAILTRDVYISIPFGWTAIVSRMLGQLCELPAAINLSLVVTSIEVDRNGLLVVDLRAEPGAMPPGTIRDVEAIIQEAKTQAAWTCGRDGRAGWLINPPKGCARTLCPDCQLEANVDLMCHQA